MAKPGDVVSFRSGHLGIDEPKNIGILLDRFRKKGTPWVRLVTCKGVQEMKAEHVSRRVYRDRYTGDLKDTPAIQARLEHLLGINAEGGLQEEAEDDLGALEEALWEATADSSDGPFTAEQLAALHYTDPSRMQQKQVSDALERCRRQGVGRFEHIDNAWQPWTRTQRAAMLQAWEALQHLKDKLVVREETEEGTHFRGIPIAEAHLDEGDHDTMTWVKAAMQQFIEHDGVPDKDVAGIGGMAATNVFGLNLHRQLGFLAMDWMATESTTKSSDYVHFLLESGQWRPEDAVASLTRRHVNMEPFFEHTPDERAEEAANALPEPAWMPDTIRHDLRDKACYTIDPPDAKDFDDAVGIEDGPDNTTRLWVHIADVSHYVDVDGRLDWHARDRATSVYLPGRVLPMLPHRIADHLCSLRDDGDRFAMSACLDIDPEGRVVATDVMASMIRVTENLHYAHALERRDAGDATMERLFALASRMQTHRQGLAIDTGEVRVMLEDTGFGLSIKHGNDATKMIETFMVAANEAVARFLQEHDIPGLFRCHPLPDPSRTERFEHQLETLGLDVPMELPTMAGTKEAETTSLLDQLKAGGGKLAMFGGGVQMGGLDEPEPEPDANEQAAPDAFAGLDPETQEAWLQPFRHAIEAMGELSAAVREVATLKMLGCMGQADYRNRNDGHFGLGSSAYLHFTSPIRRYPDSVVHRNVRWHLEGRNGEPPHPDERLENLSAHCSDQERAAMGLERRVRTACLVLASLSDPGTDSARITGITPTAVWIRRPDGIEARVASRELPGGPYTVDEWESMLLLSPSEAAARWGEDVGGARRVIDQGREQLVRAKLADAVKVRLAGRDVAAGRTDARIEAWQHHSAQTV